MTVGLGVSFLAGFLSFLTPCVLPLVPVYLAYLTGATYQELVSERRGFKTTAHAACFVLGFSLVFIAFGATATAFGKVLFHYRGWIERAGGVLLMVFGLWMAGLLPIPFLYRDLRVHLSEKPAGYAGSVLVGAAFAAGWTPCVGPVLASILLLAARSDSVPYGIGLLAVYSLGLAVPMLLCSLALERSTRLIRRFSHVLPALERATGILLAAAGWMLAAGWFRHLVSWTLGRFSAWTPI